MKRRVNDCVALLALVATLAISATASAASTGVRDNAHFFSNDAIAKADDVIQQIDQDHQRDLLIESLPNIPADQQADFQRLGKDAFYRQWVNSRARQAGVRGIYILITKDPAHLQVAVGNSTSSTLFTTADRDALSKQMLDSFKAHDYDQGLLDGVNFVKQRMDARVSSGASQSYGNYPPSSYPPPLPRSQFHFPLGGIACILIAVVLFIVLIRGAFGRSGGSYGAPGGYYPTGGYPQGGYPPGGYGYSAGGGGFGHGFLGGLLGGALGGYAADRWMQGQQQSGGSFTPPSSSGGDFSAGAGPDTSFSSSGGDFGASGGGGDFGASSGGGGDFGGGGGGSGGGGGDF